MRDSGTPPLYCQEPQSHGKVNEAALDEISGLARSGATPGEYWVVNDSGPATVHRLSSDGQVRASWPLPDGQNRDWEDIASYDADGKSWIVVGDIGDNSARTGSGSTRATLDLYRFVEGASTPTAGEVEVLSFAYPDKPHDAEALFVDPSNQDIWVITKENDSHLTKVFVWPYPQVSGQALTFVADLPLGTTSALINAATSADISKDRRRLWVRTYSAVLLWELGAGESIADAFAREPREMVAPVEIQGEAIVDAGDGFVTISEGAGATVFVALCTSG